MIAVLLRWSLFQWTFVSALVWCVPASSQDKQGQSAATEVASDFETLDGLSSRAVSIIEHSCLECHGSEKPEGHLDLSRFRESSDLLAARAVWDKVKRRIAIGDMPPKDSEPLAIEDRQWITTWITGIYRADAARRGPQPGPAPLRRLNRNQYGNTLRDLLGVHFDAGHGLPSDGAGGEGFDNSAETLFLSPVHGEKYLLAAKEALQYAASDQSARKRIFSVRPDEKRTEIESAREIVENFASRAFRRPVAAEQVDRLLVIFQAARNEGSSFDDAIYHALSAVLISPNFLFLVEPRNETSTPLPVDDYSLANRLSYFLWDSMPDKELTSVAADGSLSKDDVLETRVKRMIKSERHHEMCVNFVGQWLGTRELGRTVRPDPVLYPKLIDEVLDSYREEPVRLFEYILRENRSLLELIDCDYSFMNNDLLRLYRIDRKTIQGDVNQNLKKLPLPAEHPRGGLVTMAGVLTVSSYANRTSPVLRGKWLLETLLGDPPPPPPPGVPPLADQAEDKSGKTLRQRLELHRADATCAACHDRLDPLGFALEHFDPVGKWRDEDNGLPIDAIGEMPGGEKIEGAEGLKRMLESRKEQFVRHLTTKLLGYALGRGLVDSDYCVVDTICEDLAAHDYEARRLIMGIIQSVPFRYRHDKIE